MNESGDWLQRCMPVDPLRDKILDSTTVEGLVLRRFSSSTIEIARTQQYAWNAGQDAFWQFSSPSSGGPAR
jgi:hypothetical protein